MSLIQELDSEPLVLGGGYELALIRVDVEVLAGIDESEVLGPLYDQEDDVLNVKDKW